MRNYSAECHREKRSKLFARVATRQNDRAISDCFEHTSERNTVAGIQLIYISNIGRVSVVRLKAQPIVVVRAVRGIRANDTPTH